MRACVRACVCVVYVCAYECRWVLWVGVCEGYMCTCVGVSGCMSLYCMCIPERCMCVLVVPAYCVCVCSCYMYIYISVKMAAPWGSLNLLSYYSLYPHLRSHSIE